MHICSRNSKPSLLASNPHSANVMNENRSVDPLGHDDISISNDSTFYSRTGGVLNVCDGGSHSTFIAPPDTTNPSLILEGTFLQVPNSRIERSGF